MIRATFEKIGIWSGRVFLLVFAIYTIFRQGSVINLFQVLQQLLIVALFFWRSKRKMALPIIPDVFLLALPYLWLLSLHPATGFWLKDWMTPFLAVFSVSMLAGGFLLQKIEPSVRQGIAVSASFIILYAVCLRQFFPGFELALFNSVLLSCLAFFCGLPICYLSLKSFFPEN